MREQKQQAGSRGLLDLVEDSEQTVPLIDVSHSRMPRGDRALPCRFSGDVYSLHCL